MSTDAPETSRTYPYVHPKGVPRERKAAHYRLSKDTWAIILKEYREGATAPALVAKWRVSMHALRKQITQCKATKRDWGDQEIMAQAQTREAEEAAAWAASPAMLAARLFEDDPDEDPSMGDPAVLAKLATVASGRAMRGRLWTEAKALAGLAESYRRLAAAEAAARNTAAQAEAQSWWPKTMEEEEEMREALYGQLMRRAQAIDEEEAFEAAQGMAEAMGVEGPDLEDLWREIEASDAELATGGGGEAKAGP